MYLPKRYVDQKKKLYKSFLKSNASNFVVKNVSCTKCKHAVILAWLICYSRVGFKGQFHSISPFLK